MDWDNLLFNTATFIAAVFMLDYGADKFIDHTIIVGHRLGISQTLIALLTAGAEYEELAVVIASVLQKKSPLALGNVMGSVISNTLGAFSLGLLMYPGHVVFDRSAKVYTALLLGVTTGFCVVAYFKVWNKVTGGVLIAVFGVYMLSIFFAIHRGLVAPPEVEDSDSDDDGDGCPNGNIGQERQQETSPLLPTQETSDSVTPKERPTHSLPYHITHLLTGFLALTISGYLLSHSASTIASSLHLSSTLLGLTILSFATTLPEKFLALMSGSRGQSGIMVAATAGSNIFLLTLCAGVIALAGFEGGAKDEVLLFEIASTWVSSVVLFGVVFGGGNRVVGAGLMGLYLGFLGVEFTVYRR